MMTRARFIVTFNKPITIGLIKTYLIENQCNVAKISMIKYGSSENEIKKIINLTDENSMISFATGVLSNHPWVISVVPFLCKIPGCNQYCDRMQVKLCAGHRAAVYRKQQNEKDAILALIALPFAQTKDDTFSKIMNNLI